LLAVFAAECGEAGLSAATTIKAVNSLIPDSRTFAVVGDLNFAVRGGRVPKWVKLLADSMRMTPVIATTPSGEIKLATCLFGRRNIASRFAKYVAKQTNSTAATIVGIAHAVSPDEMNIVEATVKDTFLNIHRISTADLGTALGVHGGPGTLLISTLPYVNPQDLAE
jgi:fatty acid-binding protein DegV